MKTILVKVGVAVQIISVIAIAFVVAFMAGVYWVDLKEFLTQ